MFNNNGTKILNAMKVAVTSGAMSVYLQPTSGLVVYGLAGTASSGRVNLAASSSSLGYDTMAYCVRKINITGLPSGSYGISDAMSETSSSPAPSYTGVYFDVGYRALPFTETTYIRMDNHYDSLCSISSANGIPTITLYNSTDSAITINEIDVILTLYFGSSSPITQMNCIIAGFHFPDVVVAPNETYTFTIMHKNA